MKTYIALLRGINVGGNKKVSMAELRQVLEDLGFEDVQTILQSGNVVFKTPPRDQGKLEEHLQSATRERLGVSIDYIVRDAKQLTAVIAVNPFPGMAKDDPSHLVVMFMKQAIDLNAIDPLQSKITGREVIKGSGTELYITYPDGIGTSKLTGQVIEKHFSVRGTARNWNTVLKLADKAQD